MKKTIYWFTKSFVKIILAFVVTFITAIIASDNKNFVNEFLSRLGYSDLTMQNTVLSSLIVAAVGIFQLIVSLLKKILLWVIKNYFKRLTVNISFKVNNRNKELIKFRPINGEYNEVHVDIELEITPAGRLSLYILKLCGLQIELFFNPQVIDVTLVNDQEWLDEKANTKIDNNQALCIKVLENYRLDGFFMKPYLITESIIILPKRVKRDTAHIDFTLNSVIGNKTCHILCDSKLKDLYIECEGGN